VITVDFAGRTAVVTGAAQGFGAEIAAAFAEAGATVVVADIDVEGADRVAAALQAAGGRAVASRLDVSDPGSVRDLFAGVDARGGRPDVVV
jgi:NAD(P)-dependent dehydrogenase (short-subunit alcohol dehydrogenase family)